MNHNLPKDPVMLLSLINTELRDNYPNLKDLCASYDISVDEISHALASIDYSYDESRNQFI